MSRRPNRRAQRTKKKIIGGYALIAVVAVALVGAFAVQNMKRQDADQWDKETFCPKVGDIAITAVMIDQTDPLSAIQQASLRNELEKIRDQIPTHGRLEIYSVGNTVSDTLMPVFAMCSPGRGKDVSGLDANPKLVERRWKETFDERIEKELKKILNAPAAKESPLLESIQSISVTAFNKPESENATRRFIVASDMIHYTPQFSLYQPPGDYDSLRETDYFRKMRADLQSVHVDMLVFRRNSGAKIQNEEFYKFWDAFFTDQGATVKRVYPISG